MKLLLVQVLLALAVTDPSPSPSEPVCVPPSAASVPAAQAVAEHPQLNMFTKLVSLSERTEALNEAPAVTVFAPTDAAFERLNPEDLASILSDNVTLTNLLTYHVVPQNLAPEQLLGTHQTMQGSSLTVTEDGLVNETARIVCEAVPATNGTIYLIDAVL
ncbi:fasciclin domain-containing protein [Catelliglobosispora koreensis]|uniref:fasciclin domain-containing protein n=1 Tax=Catelliglobosispora koreensis TaxID=129052 RepID=UPI000360739B|nr:fasciclin domain-containing protein [Catelliglobosispora koreensis]